MVVDTTLQEQQRNSDFSVLGFRTILPDSTITGQNEDPNFPFSNVLDFGDNTKYSPNINSGTVTINFTQSNLDNIDYFGLAIHNAQAATLVARFEVDSGSGFEVVAEFSGLKNDRPFLKYFGARQTLRQRLVLTFTSKLFIGAIYVGRAVVFNRTPSLGFQPARFSPLDEVEQFTTDGNNFIRGRRINRGFQSRGTFRFVNFSDIEEIWEDLANHVLDSKSIFFKWSNLKDQTVYGLNPPNRLHRPTYVTSFHSDITFEINGYA